MSFSNKTYDILKNVVTIIIPAAGTLYFTLASIWGLPYAKQIVGTLAAITTFIGVCLKISSVKYYRQEDAIMDEAKYWDIAMTDKDSKESEEK